MSWQPITTFPELVERIRQVGSGGKVVALDGFMQSGKSTVSLRLASALPAELISLDTFVDSSRDAPSYIGMLNMEDLASSVGDAVKRGTTVLLEGICMLDALDALGIEPDLTIYVKRISPMGLWQDGFHFEDFEMHGEECNFTRESELEYHARRRPHEMQVVVYARQEA